MSDGAACGISLAGVPASVRLSVCERGSWGGTAGPGSALIFPGGEGPGRMEGEGGTFRPWPSQAPPARSSGLREGRPWYWLSLCCAGTRASGALRIWAAAGGTSGDGGAVTTSLGDLEACEPPGPTRPQERALGALWAAEALGRPTRAGS